MRVLVTGANGFIGKNLLVHLRQKMDIEILAATRHTSRQELLAMAARADFVFHLAGVNRPPSEAEFVTANVEFTDLLCEALRGEGNRAPVVYASSVQATQENPYGRSKRQGEDVVLEHGRRVGAAVHVYRLANVFGKWCRPNYNSVVATFCHCIARDLPIEVRGPEKILQLVHVDDVVASFLDALGGNISESFVEVSPVFETSVSDVAACLQEFRRSRSTLVAGHVGAGLMRALYSTYISYLPPESFSYAVPKYGDTRGEFVEMLKTKDSGQFSFFTAHPGVTRGVHFHHSKTEKFLVIRGRARFRFRHIVTDERLELQTSGDSPEIVETIPGWSHDITNVSDQELIVMLWANEIFDRERPDTFPHPVW